MKHWLIAGVLAVVVMSGCAASAPAPAPAPTMERVSATEAPGSVVTRQMALEALLDEEPLDFTLKDLSGVSHTLSDYKGKLVFISFFATWCPPCREEMPLFDALVKENDDVIVLAVQAATTEMRKAQVSAAEADKAAALARDYLTESKLDLMVLLDPDGKIANSEYYITQGIPGNFIVDKEGVLRYFQEGGYTKEHLDLVMTYMRALEKTE